MITAINLAKKCKEINIDTDIDTCKNIVL